MSLVEAYNEWKDFQPDYGFAKLFDMPEGANPFAWPMEMSEYVAESYETWWERKQSEYEQASDLLQTFAQARDPLSAFQAWCKYLEFCSTCASKDILELVNLHTHLNSYFLGPSKRRTET